MTLTQRSAWWLFAGSATIIYLAIYLITRTPQGLSHASLVGAAATFDLAITTSAVFYFLLARKGYSSRLTTFTIALCGFRATQILLPDAYQFHLLPSWWISVPLEFAIGAAIIRRFRRIQTDTDPLARIRNAASAVIPYRRLAEIAAAEIAVFYYAIFSWRSKPESVRNAQVFSCAEASGYSLLGTLLVLLILCEGVPLHFILSHYNPVAAWIFTGADIYGLLWAVAMIRAARLRTILVDDCWVKIRIGMIWEAAIPRQDIVSCRRITSPASFLKADHYLKAVVLNEPQYVLELSRPAVAVGFYGQRRVFTKIGIAVDQKEAFAAAFPRE